MAYDQEFFLNLALKGKDTWNEWRRDPVNQDVRVTFAGIDFSEAPRDRIDFSGFVFGNYADFSGCRWRGVKRKEKEWIQVAAFEPGRACFTGAAFGNEANFDGAAFDEWATFTGAAFNDKASFSGAAFGGDASFSSATLGRFANFRDAAFGNGADLSGAVFGEQASFDRAAFGNEAIFDRATFRNGVSFAGSAFGDVARFDGVAFRNGAFAGANFGGVADFRGAAFGDRASFADAAFGGVADFRGAAFGDGTTFKNAVFKGRVEFTGTAKEHLNKRLEDGSGPDRFLAISFAYARFNGRVDFSCRTFENDTDFNYARFCYPPVFERETNFARIDFTGAYIGIGRPGSFRLTCDTKVLLRLGALRKNAGEKRDDDRERDLYIEERKAELGIQLARWFEDLKRSSAIEWPFRAVALIPHLLWIVAMLLCWALADYGRSFMRPAGWLALSVPFFYLGYLVVLMAKVSPCDVDTYKQAVWMVALGNAVPFAGSLTSDSEVRKLLFCAGEANCLPVPPERFQLLLSGQNLLSIILVFFIVVALRNYFRIK